MAVFIAKWQQTPFVKTLLTHNPIIGETQKVRLFSIILRTNCCCVCVQNTDDIAASVLPSLPLTTEACKSLKDPPTWEHQRSLCCSDNRNKKPMGPCNVNKVWSAVNKAFPLARGCSGKRMWHTRRACDTHINLRGDEHVSTEFTFVHTHLCVNHLIRV